MLERVAQVLLAIEDKLAEPQFLGVPIGSTLGHILGTFFLQGGANTGSWAMLVAGSRLAKHFWFHPRHSAPREMPDQGRALFTWIGDRGSLNQLVRPLLKEMGSDSCTVIGRTLSVSRQLPCDSQFLTWEQMPRISMREWHREYGRHSHQWLRTLRAESASHGFSTNHLLRLHEALIVQSQRVMACQSLLRLIQPTIVVTEYDRDVRASCLILSARSMNIPTVTMMHGVVNPPYGHVPLLADVALCWGNRQKEQMIDMGVSADRLFVTGCQRLTRSLSADPREARRKAAFPSNGPLLLLASNPIRPDHRRALVHAFCCAIQADPRVSGMVRLHPSESLEFYAPERAEFPGVRFLRNATLTLDESIAAADVVVCHDSGLGNDALVKGKPVVVFDVLPLPLRNGRELVERAGCPRATSPEELLQVCARLTADKSFRSQVLASAESYVTEFCSAFGDEAARNAAEAVRDRLRRASSEAGASAQAHDAGLPSAAAMSPR
ncbi:MAG: hypothetical protein JXA57_10350 [Armatimonadetes bacterium]|nr:hypothetical protein [Armatimonadota bacterium]